MATRTVTITEAKANLLKLVDGVCDTGDQIVITRRGRPVVKIVTIMDSHPLLGSLILPDDMAAYDLSSEWEGTDLA